MPILFLTVVIDLIGFGIIIPILPFMAPQLGASTGDIALIIASYSVFSGLCGPFWGRLSDRVGRKPIILICLAGAAVSHLLLAFASTLWMVYAARILGGIMAGNFGVASAMIADITTPENRAKGMGLIGAAFGIGLVIGPFMGGWLAGDAGNYHIPILAAAALSTAAIIAGAIGLKESRRSGHDESQNSQIQADHKLSLYGMLKQTGNRLLVSQFFIHNSCVSLVNYVFPLWVGALLGWGPKEVGYLFGIQGLIIIMLQGGLIGRLSKRLGEIPLLITGVFALAAGFALATQAATQPLMITAFLLSLSGAACCMPLLNSLVSKRTPPHIRGRMLGTTTSTSAWGRTFGPLLGGALLSTGSYSLAWCGGLVLALLYFAWALREWQLGREGAQQTG